MPPLRSRLGERTLGEAGGRLRGWTESLSRSAGGIRPRRAGLRRPEAGSRHLRPSPLAARGCVLLHGNARCRHASPLARVVGGATRVDGIPRCQDLHPADSVPAAVRDPRGWLESIRSSGSGKGHRRAHRSRHGAARSRGRIRCLLALQSGPGLERSRRRDSGDLPGAGAMGPRGVCLSACPQVAKSPRCQWHRVDSHRRSYL